MQDGKLVVNIYLKQWAHITWDSQDTSNESLDIHSLGCRGSAFLVGASQPGGRRPSAGKGKGGKVWRHKDNNERRSSLFAELMTSGSGWPAAFGQLDAAI